MAVLALSRHFVLFSLLFSLFIVSYARHHHKKSAKYRLSKSEDKLRRPSFSYNTTSALPSSTSLSSSSSRTDRNLMKSPSGKSAQDSSSLPSDKTSVRSSSSIPLTPSSSDQRSLRSSARKSPTASVTSSSDKKSRRSSARKASRDLLPSSPKGRKKSSRKSQRKPSPDALSKLSKVFGISRIPAKIFKRSPPEYMKDLYASITDTGGLSRKSGPYDSNVIRSFPDKDSLHRMHFHYNLSHLEADERLLQAEFHIFKMRPKPATSREPKPPHAIMVKVYQVLDIRNMTSPKGLLLLAAKRVSAHGHGWLVFNVTKAVFAWTTQGANNFGFLVTAETQSHQHVNGSYIRFAQRNEHHDSKQPVLVVFGADGKRNQHNYISPKDPGYLETKEDILRHERKGASSRDRQSLRQAIRKLKLNERQRRRKGKLSRSKRSAKKRGGNRRRRTYDMYRYRHNRRSCSRYEMFVDFEEIGWSGWIISPNSYNAYHCSGDCPFPLGQGQKPTNHATVQSIVHALGVGKNVGTPCCVPNKLYSISLLYFDDNENVILKQYDDMVVASCGCH